MSDSDDGDFGPMMPPPPQNPTIGAAVSPQEHQKSCGQSMTAAPPPVVDASDEDDDDGDFGPMMPPPPQKPQAPVSCEAVEAPCEISPSQKKRPAENIGVATECDTLPTKMKKQEEAVPATDAKQNEDVPFDALATEEMQGAFPAFSTRYERSFDVGDGASGSVVSIAALASFPDSEGVILGIGTDGIGRWWRKLTSSIMFQNENKLFDKDLCDTFMKNVAASTTATSEEEQVKAVREGQSSMFSIAKPPAGAPKRCAVFCFPAWKIKVLNIETMGSEATFDVPFPAPTSLSAWTVASFVPSIQLVSASTSTGGGASLVVASPSTNDISVTHNIDETAVMEKLSEPKKGVSVNPVRFLKQSRQTGIIVTVDVQGMIDYVDTSGGGSRWEAITTNKAKKGATPLAVKHVEFAKKSSTGLLQLVKMGAKPVSLAMGNQFFAVGYEKLAPKKEIGIAVFHLKTGGFHGHIAATDVTSPPSATAKTLAMPALRFAATTTADAVKSIAMDHLGLDVLALSLPNAPGSEAHGVVFMHLETLRLLNSNNGCDKSNPAADDMRDLGPSGVVTNMELLQIAVQSSQKLRNLMSSMPLSISGKSIASFLEGAGELDPLVLYTASSISTPAVSSKLFCVSRRRPTGASDRDWTCGKEAMAKEGGEENGENDSADGAAPVTVGDHQIPPAGTTVTLNMLGLGPIVVKLFVDKAPLTCYNFVALADGGYYDALTFHRVIKGFMIQGGCPLGNGTGGKSAFPGGKEFQDENLSAPIDKPMLLCMANRGPSTNGSQFFITTDGAPWLNGKHTVFGEVVEGKDVVRAIESTTVAAEDKPLKEVVIESAKSSAQQ